MTAATVFTPPAILLLVLSATIAGALNAVAGGGSFLTFPSLVVAGVPPVGATATSTVALWPGSAASVGAYRRELARVDRALLAVLTVTSLAGGVLGAVLLLRTPEAAFAALVPYLLLGATGLFASSRWLTARLRRRAGGRALGQRAGLGGIALAQLVIAVYGGYFGGGIGILMLATLGLMGIESIHELNALKAILAACINGVAVGTFILAGAVAWPHALLMVAGSVAGGYGGASLARRIDPGWLRIGVVVVGCAMTAYFFVRR
jgi:uncharacterized membrane protein YfcA